MCVCVCIGGGPTKKGGRGEQNGDTQKTRDAIHLANLKGGINPSWLGRECNVESDRVGGMRPQSFRS